MENIQNDKRSEGVIASVWIDLAVFVLKSHVPLLPNELLQMYNCVRCASNEKALKWKTIHAH